jgi:hypothetical protein
LFSSPPLCFRGDQPFLIAGFCARAVRRIAVVILSSILLSLLADAELNPVPLYCWLGQNATVEPLAEGAAASAPSLCCTREPTGQLPLRRPANLRRLARG